MKIVKIVKTDPDDEGPWVGIASPREGSACPDAGHEARGTGPRKRIRAMLDAIPPIDGDDERIVDELVRQRTALLARRPLRAAAIDDALKRASDAGRTEAAPEAQRTSLPVPLLVYESIDGPSHVHADGNPAPCSLCRKPPEEETPSPCPT